MALAFYKSSSDGWRVGSVEITNLNRAVVTDVKLGVQETCAVSEVYSPSDDSNANKDHPLLSMSNFKEEFYEKTDAALMNPTPIAAMPSLIELLRSRFSDHINVVSIGDNVDLLLHREHSDTVAARNSSAPSTSTDTMVAKAVASWKANGRSQVLVASGKTPCWIASHLASRVVEEIKAPAVVSSRIEASFVALAPFTTTLSNDEKSVRLVSLQLSQNGIANASMTHHLLDLRHFGARGGCHDNFKIFSYLIYAFNHEEKERVHLNRKQLDFACQRSVKDADVASSFRKDLSEFTKALETLQIDFPSRLALFARVSTVLHLLEIDFFEDGSPTNLTALKSVARLLQLDFNTCGRIFVSKEICTMAAKWIYEATFVWLVKKINASTSFCGGTATGTTESMIHVLVLPQQPTPQAGASDLPATDLSLSTLYEDTAQSFFRSSEAELIQWQRCGFVAPDELQAVLDSFDNFPLLRLLKGKRGILSVAQSIDTVLLDAGDAGKKEALATVLKSSLAEVSFGTDGTSIQLGVRHSFGDRSYSFCHASSSVDVLTIFAERYANLRDFVFANTDIETQELLYLHEQSREKLSNQLAEDSVQLRSVVELLQREENTFWWIKCIGLDLAFNGAHVEEQLRANHLLPVLQLRRILPKRYLTCSPVFINTTFAKLLPRDKRGADDEGLRAEAILSATDTSYQAGPNNQFLVEGRVLVQLYNKLKAFFDTNATVAQQFARACIATKLIRSRLVSWKEAIASLDHQRQGVTTAHRLRMENLELHKQQRYELSEKETSERMIVRDQFWVEWVSLQTEAQQQLQDVLQRMVAKSIKKEESSIRRTVSQGHNNAVHELTLRIQERLLAQGSHLDHVVETKEKQHAAAYRRLEKEYEIHKRIMLKKVEEEEMKLETKHVLSTKSERSTKVVLERERQREELRQKLWLRQEKDRVAREQMDKTRHIMAANLQEQITMEDIEQRMARRVAKDIEDEQKRLREEQAKAIKAAKEIRQKQLIEAAKKNEREMVKKELVAQRRAETEAARKRRQEKETLLAQERERKALERLRKEEEKQTKVLTRSLLKAHELLQQPTLFEHTAQGTIRLLKQSRSASRSMSRGFVMSNGKESHPRLLSGNAMHGLLGRTPRSLVDYASVPRSARSSRSVRDASPVSNFSL